MVRAFGLSVVLLLLNPNYNTSAQDAPPPLPPAPGGGDTKPREAYAGGN